MKMERTLLLSTIFLVLLPVLSCTTTIKPSRKISLGDYDGAISDLNEAIDSNPDKAENYQLRARAKKEKGDYDGAISDYTKAIELKPEEASNYAYRADVRYMKGDYDEAIPDYEKAFQMNPEEYGVGSWFWQHRWDSLIEKGEYDKVIIELTRLIDENPEKAYYYEQRAQAKKEKNDYYGAISDYTKALVLVPTRSDWYFWRGNCKHKIDNYDGAIADYTEAIEYNSDRYNESESTYYVLRAYAKMDMKDHNGAISDFTKAIEFTPNDHTNYTGRAFVYERMHKFQEAIFDYNKALEIMPNDQEAKNSLNQLFVVLNGNSQFVSKIQVMLSKLGYFHKDIDGVYEESTEEAVIEFQKDNHLNLTKEINNETYILLSRLYKKSDGIVSKGDEEILSQADKKIVSPADDEKEPEPIDEIATQPWMTNKFQINFPHDGYETEESTIPLDAIFFSASKIDNISIKVNNQKIKGYEKPDYNSSHTTANIDWTVPLVEGKNEINFVMFTKEDIFKKKIAVVRRPKKEERKSIGNTWAIVIGIEDYDDRKMTDLDFSVDDAEDLTHMLLDQGSIPPDHIVLLTDKRGREFKKVIRKEPTLDNIRRELFTNLRKKTSKKDSVIIYYSGHGVLVPDPTSPNGRTGYLAPKDFEYDAPEVIGIRLDDIKRLAYLSPERMFLIIDSCFSGGGDKNVKTIALAGKMKAGGPNEITTGFAGKGRVLMVSSLDNQISLESETLKNSVFTYYLVDILGKGERRLSQIFDHVHSNVRAFTNGNQEPRLDTFEQKGKILLY
jgi:tetratricopeptide (TPR) repeat protein